MSVIHGDCLEVMPTMEACSIDAVITDPPYGLHFMGKEWDEFGAALGVDHNKTTERSGSMHAGTYDGRRDREFEEFMRKAFGHALRVSKPGAHLVAFGAPKTYHRLACAAEDAGWEMRDSLMWLFGSGFPKSHNLKGSAEGWGTALKPAFEPIILARKPLIKGWTVAATVHQWGTGALNIAATRVGTEDTRRAGTIPGVLQYGGANHRPHHDNPPAPNIHGSECGRWPANVVMDEAASLSLPESRFFYTAKAGKQERGKGNTHPTVKPISLMRWLARLVTPYGGLILDPFTGSGSTGVAAAREGFYFRGIEQHAEYVSIANARIAEAQEQISLLHPRHALADALFGQIGKDDVA